MDVSKNLKDSDMIELLIQEHEVILELLENFKKGLHSDATENSLSRIQQLNELIAVVREHFGFEEKQVYSQFLNKSRKEQK